MCPDRAARGSRPSGTVRVRRWHESVRNAHAVKLLSSGVRGGLKLLSADISFETCCSFAHGVSHPRSGSPTAFCFVVRDLLFFLFQFKMIDATNTLLNQSAFFSLQPKNRGVHQKLSAACVRVPRSAMTTKGARSCISLSLIALQQPSRTDRVHLRLILLALVDKRRGRRWHVHAYICTTNRSFQMEKITPTKSGRAFHNEKTTKTATFYVHRLRMHLFI